ncbi:MAG: prepilin-type N-terminal cleavage/methylation domain-containing protein, partial [Proteobacteria bacterium]|nr:prepilin-type N-terminal cleavage/methylation domain-containing protein [Pseudomonadota bacterium]
MSRPQVRAAGFTLIEILAAVVLTGIVISTAVAFQINLSNAAERATGKTREGRQAAAILDRIARDLEGSFLLVKPPEMDPLEHPWLFLGEDRRGGSGADRLKFVTFSHLPRGNGHVSDLAVVAYILEPGPGDTQELYRWTSPQLPEGQDTSFPAPGDEDVHLLADNVTDFHVRFMGEDGEWTDEWNSTTLVESSQLPLAVELHVALLSDGVGVSDDFDVEDRPGYTRRVVLPVRPIDLRAMLESEDGLGRGGSGDRDGDDDDQDDDFDDDGSPG